MLVLTRKIDDRIQIGPSITITVLRIKGRTVQIGIEAPEDVDVLRGELAAADEMRGVSGEPGEPASGRRRLRSRPSAQGAVQSPINPPPEGRRHGRSNPTSDNARAEATSPKPHRIPT
ncbi:MAG: carbon storage regulator [Pirellulales bacterium]|nr:carbon storage regulator [Pirellulales bacterium]